MPREVKHSEGREFYDDGYDSDVQSINNELDFSNLKFYGRKEELSLLHDIYTQTCNHGSHEAPIVLMDGYSGAGKSKVVNMFITEVKEKWQERNLRPCFFLSGKYEEMQGGNPLSAIVEAVSGYVPELLNGDKTELALVRQNILKEIGSDALQALVSVIPDLADVIGMENAGDSRSSRTPNAWNRLKYAFHTFLKVICTQNQPIVMFLDDLQWVDSASLDLVTAILKDPSLQNLMFIGSFRSNEVDKDHHLSIRFEEIEKFRDVERLHLLNLSIDDIGEFISDILDMEKEDAMPLTKAVYERTRGNIFFARQMLEELERKNHLFYSVINFTWEWNLKEIEKILATTDDLVDVVAGRIQSTPETLQTVLTVAAYIRSIFDIETLQKVMQAVGDSFDLDELTRILDEAVMMGMLNNKVGSKDYRFTHDKIQEAVRSLVTTDEERHRLREKIGASLLEIHLSSMEKGKDWMIFTAAEHLNSIPLENQDPLLMAKLNLEVGEKASAVAGFVMASGYLQKSVRALEKIPNHWDTHYDMSLRIYHAMADTQLILGYFDSGNTFGQEVLDNAVCDHDTLITYMSMGSALGRQGHHAEALESHWKALQLLGECRPRFQSASLFKDLAIVKMFFKTHSDKEILDLPLMNDEAKLTAMKFYDEVSHEAYYCGDLQEFMVAVLRRLRISFKYGVCGSTVIAFVHFSQYCGQSGDHQSALRLSDLALELLKTTNAKNVAARSLFSIANFTEGWSQPPSETIQRFREAEKSGMETGDIHFGLLSRLVSIQFEYMVGHPLDEIERAGSGLAKELQLYNLDSSMGILNQMRLPVLYLTGRAGAPLDWKILKNFGPLSNDSSDTYKLVYGYLGRLALAVYYCRDSIYAPEWIDGLKKVTQHDSAAESVMLRLFYSGLIFSALACKTGEQKYICKARKEVHEMKRLTKLRGVKSSHRYMLMKADLMAVRKNQKSKKVKQLYLNAIHAAAEAGYKHDVALGFELAGEYALGIGEKEVANKYLSESRNLYHEWGAIGKVDQLQKKHGAYLEEKLSLSLSTHTANLGKLTADSVTSVDLITNDSLQTDIKVSYCGL